MASALTSRSIYNSNLNVLRKRDPSIVTIFDQFSYVSVFDHNGTKWEKHGCEGTMFLYERNAYPPYGFYILNRAGTTDLNQRLYPEDVWHNNSTYTMLRFYPDFTARRIALLQAAHSSDPAAVADPFSYIYAPDMDALNKLKEGERSKVIGLWINKNEREPIVDVMKRLHEYVKMNVPVPDEYKYGPDHAPPLFNGVSRSADSSPSRQLRGQSPYSLLYFPC
jgi:hypothetical protein